MTNPMNKDQSLLHLLEDLRAEQRERWLKGDHVVAEAYFDLHPKLLAEPESALELVYSEMMLREEAGQKPQLDEYVRRFPQFAGQLPRLLPITFCNDIKRNTADECEHRQPS